MAAVGTKRLGLVVNPVAGLGGRVGLKGSDGIEIQRRARALGAVSPAQQRAAQALERLGLLQSLDLVTYPGEMGADAARVAGHLPTVIGSIQAGQTTAADTVQAARDLQECPVDLLLFVGGDGTARDIYNAVGSELPVLGVPAGVKVHSAVYATNPRSAGELVGLYLRGLSPRLREAEVLDVDEEAYRQGAVSCRLYGYLRIPYRSNLVQGAKAGSQISEAAAQRAIARAVVGKLEPGCRYVVGPGTTTRAITEELALPKTLIGVDVFADGKLLAADANEAQLLHLIMGRPACIIVTPIGGQGYLFGRGNQQISPAVIRAVGRDNIIVVSTTGKIHALQGRPLLVDSGDAEVDRMMRGYLRIVTGYNEEIVYRVG